MLVMKRPHCGMKLSPVLVFIKHALCSAKNETLSLETPTLEDSRLTCLTLLMRRLDFNSFFLLHRPLWTGGTITTDSTVHAIRSILLRQTCKCIPSFVLYDSV